ncbi:ligase-associated DNA damage response endonuclease PdeM [Sphingorhabdus arenilitoris]|uniref:Ligase-associated DNA damage response endonuclease PdeM n=1 Tax=Sphingorhabdus arenilitoris TaxID=1490041 RepID=A0ABV8RM77_9SPHN
MTDHLQFGGEIFHIVGDAALFWPQENTLLVADLHLEKASFYAKTGQMLPPYDSHATLTQLSDIAAKQDVRSVICLGDNFHDTGGEARLSGEAAILLRQLTQRYEWTWITGNHDPQLDAIWGGHSRLEQIVRGIALRHEADPANREPEISGHYHPKLRVETARRAVTRRCFTVSDRKIIMPAFGALTGGMDAAQAAFLAQPDAARHGGAMAVLNVTGKIIRFPLDLTKARAAAAAG